MAMPPHTALGNKDNNHAWDVHGRRKAGADALGVSRVVVTHAPRQDSASQISLGLRVEFRDGWTDPVMTISYYYEFYDGVGDLGGGARIWMNTRQSPTLGNPGHETALVQEPKLTFGLAPAADGTLPYDHLTVLDENNQPAPGLVSRKVCNVLGLKPDDERMSSCQVFQSTLDAGASIVRWDDNASGCNVNVHRCLYGAFMAYPSGQEPHAAKTSLWSNASYGFFAWAKASDDRSCFGLFGSALTLVGSKCNAPPTEETGGCTGYRGERGVPKQWEVHRKGGYAQVLVNGWTGGNGAYDCPIASKFFGQTGETWSTYSSFSYGPGIDTQR